MHDSASQDALGKTCFPYLRDVLCSLPSNIDNLKKNKKKNTFLQVGLSETGSPVSSFGTPRSFLDLVPFVRLFHEMLCLNTGVL
mmetsp:Transcript_6884/g.11825  ORF Transcript_6884/g.11825 Transcript_6884/m.11825 type:complete len:84 (+) Transcript_6884:1037-1288(+)